MAEFVPFGFPILGYYADYGNIDGIVRDRNVEMLEKFFNVSIEDIISCATDDRWSVGENKEYTVKEFNIGYEYEDLINYIEKMGRK